MKRIRGNRQALTGLYRTLYGFYGPQGWWPGDTRFEIIVGAILAQNTAWTNVEKAIKNLRKSRTLSIRAMNDIDGSSLAELIKPSGYYNIKAGRLKGFMRFLFSRYGGSLAKVSRKPTVELRKELLGLNGIGPETCDSILLYAFRRPVFVVDAYTRRILERHGCVKGDASYEKIQGIFMKSLPGSEKIFNEFHALIVRLGKDFCRKTPSCGSCPLM